MVMELDDCIHGRRAIRLYEDKPVDRQLLESILNAGIWAPSGVNEQPWRFIVIQDKNIIKSLSDSIKTILLDFEWTDQFKDALSSELDTIFYSAPALVIINVAKDEQWHTIRTLDCGLAAQNMMLKAHDVGLGSCFIGFGNYLNEDEAAKDKVGIPSDHEVLACMVFGYPGEAPEPKSRELKVINWLVPEK